MLFIPLVVYMSFMINYSSFYPWDPSIYFSVRHESAVLQVSICFSSFMILFSPFEKFQSSFFIGFTILSSCNCSFFLVSEKNPVGNFWLEILMLLLIGEVGVDWICRISSLFKGNRGYLKFSLSMLSKNNFNH